MERLQRYVSRGVARVLEKMGIDTDGLARTLEYIEGLGKWGKPELAVMLDECGNVQFAIIELDCGWAEWDDVVKQVKGWMRENGLDSLTSQVAIVCRRAIKEMAEEVKRLAR